MSLIILGAGSGDKPVVDAKIFKNVVQQLISKIRRPLSQDANSAHQQIKKAEQNIVGRVTHETLHEYFKDSAEPLMQYHQKVQGEALIMQIEYIFEPVLRKETPSAADVRFVLNSQLEKLIKEETSEKSLSDAMEAFDVNIEDGKGYSMAEQDKIRTTCMKIIAFIINPDAEYLLISAKTSTIGVDRIMADQIIDSAKSLYDIYQRAVAEIKGEEDARSDTVVPFTARPA